MASIICDRPWEKGASGILHIFEKTGVKVKECQSRLWMENYTLLVTPPPMAYVPQKVDFYV